MPQSSSHTSPAGTALDPWRLSTVGVGRRYFAWRDPSANPPALIVQTERLQRRFHLGALDDALQWLRARGDWVLLGGTDEYEEPECDSLEAWARAKWNPIGGWYGLRPGPRGHFATFVAPILVLLGTAECARQRNGAMIRARILAT